MLCKRCTQLVQCSCLHCCVCVVWRQGDGQLLQHSTIGGNGLSLLAGATEETAFNLVGKFRLATCDSSDRVQCISK